LTCRARNLPPLHPAQPRGVISYYAAAVLAAADTVTDWLTGIEALVQQDVQANRLSPFYHPHLAVLGDVDRRLPGRVKRS
jgi:hypothetical protein